MGTVVGEWAVVARAVVAAVVARAQAAMVVEATEEARVGGAGGG